jgi:hypothetical protein
MADKATSQSDGKAFGSGWGVVGGGEERGGDGPWSTSRAAQATSEQGLTAEGRSFLALLIPALQKAILALQAPRISAQQKLPPFLQGPILVLEEPFRLRHEPIPLRSKPHERSMQQKHDHQNPITRMSAPKIPLKKTIIRMSMAKQQKKNDAISCKDFLKPSKPHVPKSIKNDVWYKCAIARAT